MPNAARVWLQGLFERHGVAGPDERPLYAYRCTEADFDELSQLTGPVLASTIGHGALREAPGGLFCLFAAEWIRRSYSGGQLRYADILAAANAPALPYPVLQDLVQRGLRFWRRPLLRVGQARIFLLTLACEGGLPMQFLHRDGAALRRYFRALLRDVQTYRGAGLSSETLAVQVSSYLPVSLRQEPVYALAAQIVDWELIDWNLRDDLLRWAAERKHVDLYVEPGVVAGLSADVSNSLASLLDVTSMSLYVIDRFPEPQGQLVCEVLQPGTVVRWGVESEDARTPGPDWGLTGADGRCVRAVEKASADLTLARAVPASELRRLTSDAVVSLSLIHDLDGDIVGFGERFWNCISAQVPAFAARLAAGAPLTEIAYVDRYLAR